MIFKSNKIKVGDLVYDGNCNSEDKYCVVTVIDDKYMVYGNWTSTIEKAKELYAEKIGRGLWTHIKNVEKVKDMGWRKRLE